jgi:hypothetical protein
MHSLAAGVESTEKNPFNPNITHRVQFTNSVSIGGSTMMDQTLKLGVPIPA